jgi:hypothetical protein
VAAVSTASYRISPHVSWVDAETLGQEEPTVYLAAAADAPPVVLEGAAWAIWTSVADGGTLDEITRRTAELTGNASDAIGGDVEAFVESLTHQGLLVRRPAT